MPGKPLFDIPFLSSRWETEFTEFQASEQSQALLRRLKNWSKGGALKETSSEASFIKQFFHTTWGYAQEGDSADGSFHCYPKFPIAGAGQQGGTGQADLALGLFKKEETPLAVPQVLCEFKDIHSGLDAEQNRKGNNRSPVKQCFAYLRGAADNLTGGELVKPYWAIVTDMNEFRLYCTKFGLAQYQGFIIEPGTGEQEESLLAKSDSAEFLRFIFWKLFHRSSLLSERGTSYLQQLLEDQLVHEKNLENDFYSDYRAYREHLYLTIREHNPGFAGTPGELVRLTQRLLDRCIFILFCEDMGRSLDFPGDLLRDVLIEHSCSKYYNPNDMVPWERLKNIFTLMADGGVFGDQTINRFNGGLFEPLPALENLQIPAKVFCAKNQGTQGHATLLAHPLTLLYFSAKYNFGIKNAAHERVIDFYALGRIFEQSITELEIMEAEAEGRPSINLLSKRKRNGVYYTPEWVTEYIVRETVGARLSDIKNQLGLVPEREPKKKDVEKYGNSKRKNPVLAWVHALSSYQTYLETIRIVDPACGSGAFLVQALEFLKSEYKWIYAEQNRCRGKALWEEDHIMKGILANNLYGVDINPESVEITKLALWMHTALPKKVLSHLDNNIQCGNSLVGRDFDDFYVMKHDSLFAELDQSKRERVNVFDWEASFPKVFEEGGFDCVIGNPPYVKLQNFRKIEADVAEYLVNARRKDGSPRYASTQSGNFDLYLPFIEKGIELLKPEGRMGYIAPNVWMVNEYGKSLRKWLKQRGNLDRWIDFKSFQVFEEAITYTALQFFRGKRCEAIRCLFASDGDITTADWSAPHAAIGYEALSDSAAWNLLPDVQMGLLTRLAHSCTNLSDSALGIFVGIQTSSNEIYHLKFVRPGVYLKIGTTKSEEVEMEDELIHPLINGPSAKRYLSLDCGLRILVPYRIVNGRAVLIDAATMSKKYPKAWKYLLSNESILRARERHKMDLDNAWWGYNYPKNIEKQCTQRLLVAGTAPSLRVSADFKGRWVQDDRRVFAIQPRNPSHLGFLMAVLNSPVADYIFRQIARPKEGGFFDIEKQFLAPLPIPDATDAEKKEVGRRAMALQEMHTRRRDAMDDLERRLESKQMTDDNRKPEWLWADAKVSLQKHLDDLDARLHAGATLTVESNDHEIRVLLDGSPLLEMFDQPQTPFIAAQWRHRARTTNITEKFTAKRFLSLLLNLRNTNDEHLRNAVVSLDAEIVALSARIAQAEAELNHIIYRLYDLSPEEIQLVEGKSSAP